MPQLLEGFPMLVRKCLLALSLLAAAGLAAAKDARDDETAKQKAGFEANFKKAGLAKLAAAETADLIVYAAVTDAKVKPLAETLQKAYLEARKALKVEDKDKPWPGKLTVVVLTDSKQYANYVRLVEQRRPDKKETYAINLKGDLPYVIDAAELGEKPTDAELTADAAGLVAAAVLNRKFGTGGAAGTLPEWIQVGFGKAMAARAGPPAKFADYKAKLKAAAVGTKGKPSPARLADVWSGVKSKDSDLVNASYIEFMMNGPYAAKFNDFVSGFKVSEENPMPSWMTVFTTLEWKSEEIEVQWKLWLSKWK
jgi:hypothetical protein